MAIPEARAQAAFAGSYAGTINTRVSVQGVLTQESPVGPYLAVVSAEGTINVSAGVLTGTVTAGGAVTFTGERDWRPSGSARPRLRGIS